MKQIFKYTMALVAAAFTFASCTVDNDAIFTAGEDDFPQILNTNIPTSTGGQPSSLPAITRDHNFVFEVLVTPANYTTVTWEIDGEQVWEGNTIDVPLLAGTHDVKIVATTTKGKQTWRYCTLEVLPLDGDPSLASDAKSRWLQVGKTVTISGENLQNVIGLIVGKEVVENFENDGQNITFTVPEMEDGDYQVTMYCNENENTVKYGGGKFTVSHKKYVEEGSTEVVLFEGSADVHDWGKLFVVPEYDWTTVAAGTILHIDATMIDHSEKYASFHLMTPSWGEIKKDIAWGDLYGAGLADGSVQTLDLELTQDILDKVIAGGGMAFQGFGFCVKKVYFEGESGPKKVVLFESNGDEGMVHDWGKLFVLPEYDWSTVPAGTIMYIDATMIDHGEKYASFHLMTPSWGEIQKDNGWGDLYGAGLADGSVQTLELTLTQDILTKAIEGGGMAFQGLGFCVKKIYFELPAPAKAQVVFEGSADVHDWGKLFVVPVEDWSTIKAGSVMSIYATMIDHGEKYASFHMMTPGWGEIQKDFTFGGEKYAAGLADGSVQQLDIELTETLLSKVVEGGGMAFQGFGFTVKKIVIE